jgi:diacylglycerol kinase
VGLGIERRDWIVLVFAIALVWVAESLNTAIEFLADAAVPDHHALVKHAKDIAAAAVLLAAGAAVLIGVLLFLPYLR